MWYETYYNHCSDHDSSDCTVTTIKKLPVVFALERVTPNGMTAIFNLKEELVDEALMPRILYGLEQRFHIKVPGVIKLDSEIHTVDIRGEVKDTAFRYTGWDRDRREIEVDWSVMFASFYGDAGGMDEDYQSGQMSIGSQVRIIE